MPITPAQLRTLATTLTQDGVLDKADVDQLVDATMQDGALDAAEKAELKQILVDLSDRVDTAATHSRLAAFLDMPDDAVRSLAHGLERDDGVIDAADAQKLVDLAKADGTISGEEKASLAALLLAATLSPAAKQRLQAAAGRVEASVAPDLSIPDDDPAGVASKVAVDADGKLESIEIDVELAHTYKGDLTLTLTAPDGTRVNLHDRAGRSGDDIRGTFPTTLAAAGDLGALKGKDVRGDWTLSVVDSAGQDVGTLESWGVRITTEASTQPGGAKPMDPTGNHRPVFLSDAGWFVEDASIDKPADDAALASGLFRMAQLVDDMKNDPLQGAALTLAQRQQVFDNLETALAKVAVGQPPPQGMTPVQALQMRSSLATVLLSLVEATGNSGGEKDLKEEAFAAYARALKAETNAVLRDSMVWGVARVADALPAGVRAQAKDIVEEIAPTSPPYDEWFANGNNTLNVSWKTGSDEEFYPGTVELLKKQGFTAEGNEPPRGPAVYSKKVTNDQGVETTLRIHMGINRSDIFDPMDDKSFHIVGYDGHSNIGRNIPQSLRNAPDADGKKLIFYGLCAGKDNLSRVRDRFGDAQVLTTFNSSYFNTREDNGRKVMTRSENFNVLMELVHGAAHRRGWNELNDNIKNNAILYPWHHPMPGRTNYISPVHTDIRRKVLDTDHDGQADYLDKLVNFDTVKVNEDTAREFTAIDSTHPPEKLDGTVPHLAAMALNTATGYNTHTQGYKKQQIIGDGYFTPAAGDADIVRFERTDVDGLPTLKMKVNAQYAHMSVEALRAIAHYAFIQESETRLSDADRKLMGLVFAAFSINYDEAWSSRDNQIWKGLLDHFNLPSDLPLGELKRLLDDEHHDYSGNTTHISSWKQHISAASLDALTKPEVGVPG
jgi:subtilisin-like proprotein convertase family protein/tellurite resistance protein